MADYGIGPLPVDLVDDLISVDLSGGPAEIRYLIRQTAAKAYGRGWSDGRISEIKWGSADRHCDSSATSQPTTDSTGRSTI